MTGRPPGKRARVNRPIEREGVRAVRGVFEDANHYFQEVGLENDIGKDAYVDLADAGVFSGAMVAVQVKSGEKYRRGDDYRIACEEDDFAMWRGSPVPIVGVVYDKQSATLHWTDLTAWAKAQFADDPPKYCFINRSSVLSAETLDDFVAIVHGRLRELTDPTILDLASEDPVSQTRAVYDCWAVGMRDPRALLLLRSSLRWLADGDPTRLAVMSYRWRRRIQMSSGLRTIGYLSGRSTGFAARTAGRSRKPASCSAPSTLRRGNEAVSASACTCCSSRTRTSSACCKR